MCTRAYAYIPILYAHIILNCPFCYISDLRLLAMLNFDYMEDSKGQKGLKKP